ncbi:hypothetical protein THICB1_130057 [Thiomonas arsenitoxydans]|uniref:Uncharacterized protein n=1 Tax=Thiomonas arsenitoxydans (strain DSM 22701 / CIP 110005 / 3As) TaxID=426114 RepID=A0ABP1Z692_THIA3|nr:hypothetical protein THICB6_140057 [Thiomonas arsenitoxydans]CQR30019.1 hypothetical protein THICB1_130057 [Thiomonas arsenitoxydans]
MPKGAGHQQLQLSFAFFPELIDIAKSGGGGLRFCRHLAEIQSLMPMDGAPLCPAQIVTRQSVVAVNQTGALPRAQPAHKIGTINLLVKARRCPQDVALHTRRLHEPLHFSQIPAI